MKNKIIHFLTEKPKATLLVLVLFIFSSLPGLGFIQEDFTYSIWYNKEDSLMKLFKQFQKKFGNDDKAIIGIYNENGITEENQLKLIEELAGKFSKLKDIVRVEAVTNANIVTLQDDELLIEPLYDSSNDEQNIDPSSLQEKALTQDSIKDVFLSHDGKFALIALTSRPDFKSVPNYYGIAIEINKILDEYKDVRFYRGGSIILTYWFKQVTIDDMNILAPLAMFMFIILLALFYRRISGVLIPLGIIVCSVIVMSGFSGYLGHTLNTISSAAPTILLTVALADAVHLLTYYFFELKKGKKNKEAVFNSLQKNFYPTLITSITTFLGFISFGGSHVVPVADLGVQVGLGVMFAWIISFLFFPCALLLARESKINATNLKFNEEEFDRVVNRSSIITNLIQHKFKYFSIVLLISGVSFYFGSKLYVSMDPIKQFRDDHIVSQDFNGIEKLMGAASSLEIMIKVPKSNSVYDPKFLGQVDDFLTWLNKQDFMNKSASALDIIKNMNRNLHQGDQAYYVIPPTQEEVAQTMLVYELGLPAGQNLEHWISLKKDALRVTAYWTIHSSEKALAVVEQINKYGKEHNINLQVTGKMPLFHNLTPYVVKTFFISFITALVLITGIMILLLRSFKLGILTLIPNIFPLLIGGALVYFLQWQVDIGIVIVASVCLGIAVDDSIHILFEYQRLRSSGKTVEETFQIIFENTLPALFITTLIICLGFGTFFLADYLPNSRFGVLVAIILSIAFIADALLFPVVMAIFDKNKD